MVAVQQRSQLRVTVASRSMRDQRVRAQHGSQATERIAGGCARLREFLEVLADLAFVPCPKDGLDVGEVLVEGGSPDAGLLRNLRHRDGSESLLGDERDGGVLDRLAHLLSVALDRFGPQLRHPLRIQLVFDTYTLSRKLRHLESREASMSSPQPPP